MSKAPTTLPSSSPLKEIVEDASANKFAFYGISITSHDDSQSVPEDTSQADSFAVSAHSKASNSVTSTVLPVLRTKSPTASPVSSPPTSLAPTSSPLQEATDPGEMANWALTQLDELSEPEPAAENSVNVQDITFRPPAKSEEVTSSSHEDIGTTTSTKLPIKGLTLNNVGTIEEMTALKEDESAPDDVSAQVPNGSFSMSNVGTIVQMNSSTDQEESLPDDGQPSGTISGRISLKNEDGDEVGLRAILVDLFSCDNDEWIEGTRTASSGDYIFDELGGGKYYLKVTAASTFLFAIDDSNNDVDSDGQSECIELSSAKESHTINADLVKSEISSTLDVSNEIQVDSAPVVDAPNSESILNHAKETIMEVPNNCRGQPCSGEGECRSRYSFCGTGESFCNDDSQWTPDCGTISPTAAPSSAPTTGQPTFVFDLQMQCSGEPCTEGEGNWCRSELGFCGGGGLYCNPDSIWIPECITSEPTKSPSQVTSTTSTVLLKPESQEPSAAPNKSPIGDSLGFSSFALPTLEVIPREEGNNQISATGHERTSIKNEELLPTVTDEGKKQNDAEIVNEQTMQESKSQKDFDSSWYDRYSYLDSLATRNVGCKSVPAHSLPVLLACTLLMQMIWNRE
jgi:hypothetical protein